MQVQRLAPAKAAVNGFQPVQIAALYTTDLAGSISWGLARNLYCRVDGVTMGYGLFAGSVRLTRDEAWEEAFCSKYPAR